MRLTLSALLCAALFASPAFAGDHRPGPMLPPGGSDMPPPPYYGGPGYGGPGYGGPGYGGPGYGGPPYGDPYHGERRDPRWRPGPPPMHGEWIERCRDHHGGRGGPAYAEGCGHPAPYGYPGAYMGYAVPMMMVPVLRSKPCEEVVEEIVEEVVVPTRWRVIRPRPAVVQDKRVPMTDKRVKVAPTKRIAY